jgi:DNA-binding NtrC family response regulator
MRPKDTILVIDDEPATLKVMEANLRREGYAVCLAGDGETALGQLSGREIDAVVADYMMPHLDGIGLLERMRALGLEVPVIIMTAYGTIENAVKAMRLGAANYLTKPIDFDELLMVLKKELEQHKLKQEVARLRQEVRSRYSFANLIGKSPAMQAIYDLIADLADTDATVLIQGETGTGKELLAKAIHYNSARRDRPFVGVSCAALPETLLESELFGHEKGAFTGAVKTRRGRFELADGGGDLSRRDWRYPALHPGQTAASASGERARAGGGQRDPARGRPLDLRHQQGPASLHPAGLVS